jgi:hypothetical protein
MKTKQLSILAVLICLAAIPAFAQQTIAGKWEGKIDGLPWVTLQITQDHGNLAGTATFYIHDREHPGDPSKGILGKTEVDLVNARLSGNTLLFDVCNHDKSGVTLNAASNELLSFRMTLTGKYEGLLKKVGEEDDIAPVKMIRQKATTI